MFCPLFRDAAQIPARWSCVNVTGARTDGNGFGEEFDGAVSMSPTIRQGTRSIQRLPSSTPSQERA
jgi:hypothetical protein